MFKTVDKSDYKQYPAFRLYPFRHKLEKMPWGAASVVDWDKVENLIFCAGETGRDPEKDRQPKTWEEERAGVGVVVGGIKEQTVAVWERLKEVLEAAGATLEDIIYIRRFLINREDWFDCREAEQKWFEEHCPDLLENPRPGTLLKGIKLDLPDMLIEIDVIAATAKK